MSHDVAATTVSPRQAPSARARIQAFGGFLTAMVIPNMGAFIAWGLITALFIPTGWIPNADLAKLVSPMVTYMLPSLLAYTGGALIHEKRGGVIAVVTTIGLIVGSTIPMFLGAMIMGPLSAWILKKWDNAVQHRVRAGFEMVVNNFSLGIIGFGLCLVSYKVIGPLVLSVNDALTSVVNRLVETGVLPVLAVLNEPAKVLFLNNVIDQGIYYPLGMQHAATDGRSIFFMLASNPGPGLGLLLAYALFSGNKVMRETAPGAMIIHFLGGIHEIYFPYVLAKPVTLVGMIAGAASGIATAQVTHAGLTAGPSPGSIFAYLLLTPKGSFLGVIADVLVATVVSFVVNAVLLRASSRKDANAGDDALARAQEQSSAMKREGQLVGAGVSGRPEAGARPIRKVVFACDAGMGSSVMGATVFRRRLQEGDLPVNVEHTAIERIPDDADVVVTHRNLAERARMAADADIVSIEGFMSDPNIDQLYTRISEEHHAH